MTYGWEKQTVSVLLTGDREYTRGGEGIRRSGEGGAKSWTLAAI